MLLGKKCNTRVHTMHKSLLQNTSQQHVEILGVGTLDHDTRDLVFGDDHPQDDLDALVLEEQEHTLVVDNHNLEHNLVEDNLVVDNLVVDNL